MKKIIFFFLFCFYLQFLAEAQELLQHITSSCLNNLKNTSVSCPEGTQIEFEKDSIHVFGTIGANCCGSHFLTFNRSSDTIILNSTDTGMLCNCVCSFCFDIKIQAKSSDKILQLNGANYSLSEILHHEDWQMFTYGRDCFFEDEEAEVIALKIDSATNEGNTLHFFKNIQALDNHCYLPNSPSWMGERLDIDDDSQILYNRNHDSLVFKLNNPEGSEWNVCKIGTNGFIKAKITREMQMNFLGVTDSVKVVKFKIENEPSIAELWLSDSIIVSKKYGMIRTFNFFLFPDLAEFCREKINTYSLCGLTNPKIGLQNLTWKEVYDINPGDEIHTYSIISDWIIKYEAKTKLKYLEKKEIKDTIIFKIWRQQIVKHDSTYYLNDTIVLNIKPYFVFDKLPGVPVQSNDDLYCFRMNRGTFISKISPSAFDLLRKHDTCWSELAVDGCFPDYNYYKGLGGPYYICQNAFSPGGEKHELVYYKKGNETWGTPYLFTSIDNSIKESFIEIHPNPVSDALYVTNKLKDLTLVVYNAEGKQILKNLICLGENEIEFVNHNKGFYFYKILDGDKTLQSGKFVKN